MCQFRLIRRAAWSDPALVLYLVLLTVILGYAGQVVVAPKFNLPTTTGYPLEIPVMIATGRGFVDPAGMDDVAVRVPNAPELGRFLREEIPRLGPGDIPADLRTMKPSYYWVYYHSYMYYTIGWLWRLFGISWGVVLALRLVLFCVMMVASFGLFRLALGRTWSLACTVALFPGFFVQCFDLRDFSKAAFILPAMFILGFLVKHPVRTSRFLAVAALLGLIAGVGIGFRADVSTCVPAAAFVLACCARPDRPGPCLRRWIGTGLERVAAISLLAGFFLASGWPILQAYHADRLSAHDFSKGLATVYDDTAGVGRASYERVYKNDDFFVEAVNESHSARMRPSHETARDSNARREGYTSQILRAFPGDMVVRAQVAVLWVLRGRTLAYSPGTAVTFWKGFAGACAAAALLLAARRDLRRALMLLALLLYFCGYLSFQTTERHGFHLGFVPLLMTAFLVDSAVRAGRRAGAPSGQGRAPLRRMAFFFVAAMLVLPAPLYAARALQQRTLGPLLEQYAGAELEPVPVETHLVGDWVLFRRLSHSPAHSGALSRPNQTFLASYWVAEFSGSAMPRQLCLRYACKRNGTDFSQGVWVRPSGPGDTGTMRYFFPVYENTDMGKHGWALFSGIALPKGQAGELKGLYRVRNDALFPLFLNLSMPADPSSFLDHQSVLLSTPPPVPEVPEEGPDWLPNDPELQVLGMDEVASLPEPDKAVARFNAALASDMGNPELRLGLAAALEAKGNPRAALEAYQQALSVNPRFYVTYHYIDAYFGRMKDLDGRVAHWRTAAQVYTDNWLPHFHLGLALEEKQDRDGALEAYRRVVALNPNDLDTWADIARLLAAKGDQPGAEEALRRSLEIEPHNPYALMDLGDLEIKRADHEAAQSTLRAAVELDPEQARAHSLLLQSLTMSGDYAAAWEEVAACGKAGVPVSEPMLEMLKRLSGRAR